MNNLILIKSGPYSGQRVIAEKVPAQDGLRYCCQIDGKTIGFKPNEVFVLPDDHPLARKMEKELEKKIECPAPTQEVLKQEDIDQIFKSLTNGNLVEAEGVQPLYLTPEGKLEQKPEPEAEINPAPDPVPAKKRRGRPRKILSDQVPAPTAEKPAKKGIPAAVAVKEATKILQGPKSKPMDIVIDFDGTVVTHEFPKIGKDIGAVPVLKDLVSNGHRLILFTMRSDIDEPIIRDGQIIAGIGRHLTAAIGWFAENRIPLFGIQTNPTQHWTKSPKAYGNMIIDDAALGCPLQYKPKLSHRPFVDWIKVRQQLVSMRLIDQSAKDEKLF